jgi:hypothetical protein
MTVTGFADGQFDVVHVVGAVTFGGVLNVTVSAATPAEGTSIKLFNAGTYAGDFTQPVNVPANYSFDKATGMLTYSTTISKLDEVSTDFKVYPTLASDKVQISGEKVASVEIISLTGQVLKRVQAQTTITSIPLAGLANGAYLVKVRFSDDSFKVQHILFHE